jgi:kelch-like protein 18
LASEEDFVDKNWAPDGFAQMEEMRRLGKLCDITLDVQGVKFTAHRIVLAASIPYFKVMLLQEMAESNKKEEIKMKEIESSALEQFINYSYNGRITITNDNVQSLLIGANFFHLKSIKTACCDFVKKRLTVQDALIVKQFAEQLMCHDLVQEVNRFVCKNFTKIVQTQEFFNLSYPEMADILSKDDLNVDCEEQVIFNFIFET